jgi:hypothetical protein
MGAGGSKSLVHPEDREHHLNHKLSQRQQQHELQSLKSKHYIVYYISIYV